MCVYMSRILKPEKTRSNRENRRRGKGEERKNERKKETGTTETT
jgi:hypothetical protein